MMAFDDVNTLPIVLSVVGDAVPAGFAYNWDTYRFAGSKVSNPFDEPNTGICLTPTPADPSYMHCDRELSESARWNVAPSVGEPPVVLPVM